MASSSAPPPPPPTSTSDHIIPETAIIVTDKCYVRPWEETDVEASAELCNDPEIGRWMRNTFPHPYTLENAKSWVEIAVPKPGKPVHHFVIVSREDGGGAFAGAVGLKVRDDIQARNWELGYWVGRRYWGKGLATAAVGPFVRWAFRSHPDLLRLHAEVFEGNPGSEAVLRKVGFVKEGLLRQAVFKNGVVLDQSVYGLLRQDVESN
ncbi:hypothetical protein MGN70_002941 [Eutypa lata]|uniref:Putative gcn5-related n-acetyltransferase protein n=1 Tax=Eutypa lata (strain UCR-EL1) TaxID=1287681 RepID=M7TGL0_EUTLA|nr:putative gcn5-related n-acetyltransferase protein [Eutypa lata UCREL1]KAI1254880.1 hypothetical protein MGN70_002941 [Eutypa lata]